MGFLQLATGDACDFFGCLAGYGSGFDGDRVAFHATFGDGSQGIYLAFVNTPLSTFAGGVETQKRGPR